MKKAKVENEGKLKELLDLRLRGLITDEEFSAKRLSIRHANVRLDEAHHRFDPDPFEPIRTLQLFKDRAMEWLSHGDPEQKKLVVNTVGSNLTLRGKKLSIRAKKPFQLTGDPTALRTGLGASRGR